MRDKDMPGISRASPTGRDGFEPALARPRVPEPSRARAIAKNAQTPRLAQPGFQRMRRLASLWCGRCGNRCAQSRATSARKPASLRRPSRWRTCAMASSSASLQAGAGPRARRDRDDPGSDQVVDQRVDVDEQVLGGQHGGRPLRLATVFDKRMSAAEALS